MTQTVWTQKKLKKHGKNLRAKVRRIKKKINHGKKHRVKISHK